MADSRTDVSCKRDLLCEEDLTKISMQTNNLSINDPLEIDLLGMDVEEYIFLKNCFEKEKNNLVCSTYNDVKENVKSDIINELKTEEFERQNTVKKLEEKINSLQEDKEFLKEQLKELTSFLDALVTCLQRQNHQSVTKDIRLHKDSTLTHDADISFTSNVSDNYVSFPSHDADISFTSNVSDNYVSFPSYVSDNCDVPINNTINRSENNEETEAVMIKLSIDDQLKESLNLHEQMYQDNRKRNKELLKTRLERLADYGTLRHTSDNDSNVEHGFNNINVVENMHDDDLRHTDDNDIDAKHDFNNINVVENMPVTYILGDSIIKEIKGWKINEKLENKEKIVVKSFSGATTKCMREYIKPSLNQRPDHIIIHAGTNDLASNQTEEEIAHSIVDLAVNAASVSTVAVSALVLRDDRFSRKAKAVNNLLQQMCHQRNICFIPHYNINKTHLNGSKLHLNKSGTKLLTKNFANFIRKK